MPYTIKRYFIFIILIFAIIGLALLQSKLKKTSIKQEVPEYINQIKGNLPIKSEKNFTLNAPAQVPTLRVKFSKITESQAKTIANNLGIDTDPQNIKDALYGEKLVWANKEKYLFFTPKTNSFSYGLNTQLQLKDGFLNDIEEDELISKTISFLSEKFFIPENTIKHSSTNYLLFNPPSEFVQETSKSMANVYKFNFTYNNLDYEIISLPDFKPIISVKMLANGTIAQVNLTRLDEIELTNKTVPIKSANDINNSLDEAILIALKNTYVNIESIPTTDLKNIEITKAELKYLLEDIKTDLTPILLLEGNIAFKDSASDQAILYLPAIKK